MSIRIGRILILIIFGSATLVDQGQAWIADDLGNKTEVSQKGTILVIEPRVYAGSPLSKHALLSSYSYAKVLAQNAIYDSAKAAFEEKGYRVSTMQLPHETEDRLPQEMKSLDQVWDKVVAFSEKGKPDKRKNLPYKIDLPQNLFAAYKSVDLLVFVEVYGDFNSTTTWKEDAAGKLVLATATAALTGFAIIFAGSTTSLDYKMSFYDSKSGGMIWFKEGTEARTEITSEGRLISLFTDIFGAEIPKCINVAPVGKKFGAKRSAIHKSDKGAVNE